MRDNNFRTNVSALMVKPETLILHYSIMKMHFILQLITRTRNISPMKTLMFVGKLEIHALFFKLSL